MFILCEVTMVSVLFRTGRPARCVLSRETEMKFKGKRHPFLGVYKVSSRSSLLKLFKKFSSELKLPKLTFFREKNTSWTKIIMCGENKVSRRFHIFFVQTYGI